MRLPAAVVLAAALLVAAAAPAAAYKLADITPQPRLLYHVGLTDWKQPIKRVVKALNRANVGVRLVEADIPQQASIQIGRLQKRCGFPGINATTQTIEGGYAAIYLPRGCKPVQASVIAAHELGHALGLLHEDRRCALMNSSGTGPRSTPTRCLGRRYDWLRSPFRADDLAGLRKLFRNTPPTVGLALTGPSTVPAGTPVTFELGVTDKEDNLSEIKVDYGDGNSQEYFAGDPLPSSHTFGLPGTYTITVTAVDYYLEPVTASVTVTVT